MGPAKSFLDLVYNAPLKYDYYAFCDQDDYWKEDKLYKAIERLEHFDDKPALYKAQKKQSIYFIKLTAIIVVGFVFNVICYNLYKVKESFAVGTLLSAVCWYFLCLPDFKWIKYNTKEKLYPFIQTCAFLVCGFCFSAIPGFFIYIFEIMVVTWISFPKETKFIINEAKSKLAHLK